MRVAGIAVRAWLAAVLVTVAASALFYRELPSPEDLVGTALTTLLACAALVLSCYLPGLWLLRQRLGARLSPVQTGLTTAVVLNAPAFLVLAIMAGRADVFATGESLWFAIKVLLFGLFFGLGFAGYRRRVA
jgi:hypothetical protein